MNRALIESDPSVMMGKPVIAGTRVTVETILEKLAAGETVEQILEAHPRVTPEAVRAAQRRGSVSAQSLGDRDVGQFGPLDPPTAFV